MTMLALATCCLMTLAMGTLHSWSVFSADLEHTLDLSRTQSSLVYSLTLVALTLTVLIAVPLFSRLRSWVLFTGAAALAGTGLLLASSGSTALLFVGYSVLFGIANGIGYGFALQLSARALSHKSGFAMGITTAAYALGATIGAQLLGNLVDATGSLTTLRLHGVSFLVLSPVLGILIRATKLQYTVESQHGAQPAIDSSLVHRYRICYGLAVFAGLMAIAHATPYIMSFAGNTADNTTAFATTSIALWGAVVLGTGNALGGVIAGIAADKYSAKSIITLLPAIAGIALGSAAFSTSVEIALAALVLIGFTYGALIAVYPVAIARHFGGNASATAYGRIFIAWGAAGLLAPVIAGALYDVSQSYRYSMLFAMFLIVCKPIKLITRHCRSPTLSEVFLWGALRPAAGGEASVSIEATSIRELLRKLEEQYPLMTPFLESGVAVSIDGVIYQDNWSKQLPADAEIYLLPRIQGG